MADFLALQVGSVNLIRFWSGSSIWGLCTLDRSFRVGPNMLRETQFVNPVCSDWAMLLAGLAFTADDKFGQA